MAAQPREERIFPGWYRKPGRWKPFTVHRSQHRIDETANYVSLTIGQPIDLPVEITTIVGSLHVAELTGPIGRFGPNRAMRSDQTAINSEESASMSSGSRWHPGKISSSGPGRRSVSIHSHRAAS